MTSLFNERNGVILAFIVALVFPLISNNNYHLYIISLAFIWAIGVYGLNMIGGFTGQLSLAHAGFFAIGAYGVGLLTVDYGMNFWLALVLALIITVVIGFLIGLIALRTKEHFFAIYTLCVGYIIYLVIYKTDAITHGVRGVIGIPNPTAIGPISFISPIAKYYLMLFFLVVTIFAVKRIIHSLVGRTFIAIRNSEELAQAIGISTMRNKLISFVISTFFAGLGGGLYASFVRFLGPELAYISITFEMLTFLLVGGIGSLAGPIIGTLLVTIITQSLQFLQDYRMIIYGPILIFIIVFYPWGIAGKYQEWKMHREIEKLKKEQIELMQKQAQQGGVPNVKG
ncbi:MAG: branched-chain amino acid ABC transporter permease [Bacillota bacterium]|nr:branched-chain amino acid ABC transporter permease [Bacillota bacterium]